MTNIRKLLAAFCLVLPLFAGGCNTFRNLAADGLIAGGSAGGAVAGAAVGGPAGLTVLLASVVGVIVLVNLFFRPDVAAAAGGATTAAAAPWFASSDFYWGWIFLGAFGGFALKLAWSILFSKEGRFHNNILTGISLLYQRRFREAWLFILADSGTEHTPEKPTKPTEPQEPKA